MNTLGQRLRAAFAALASLLLLINCGGVGQDGTGAVPDTLTTGVVNGFGSVVVNGIHFDVNRATIVVDGIAGRTQGDLRVGMVVAVTGTVAANGATGTATRLVYESLLRGTVAAAPINGEFTVLNQRVVIDDATVFTGLTSSSDLAAGDHVQVSGFRAEDGSLRASWVSREASAPELQFVASVSAYGGGNTVTVGGLAIDISSAELIDVTRATLAPGQIVRVVLQAAPSGGAATATKLRLIDTSRDDALVKQQRQGIVMGWNASAGTFTLNGQAVRVNSSTDYNGADPAASMANGARIEVTGVLSNGVLVATRVRFLLTAYARGTVRAISAERDRFMLFTATGLEVRVRAYTALNDHTGTVGSTLTMSNLSVGDEVLVVGQAGSSRIDAETITLLPTNTPGSGVAGPVTAFTAPASLTMLGVIVTPGASANYFDALGAPLTRDDFFTRLSLNSNALARAEGIATLGGLTASTLRLVR